MSRKSSLPFDLDTTSKTVSLSKGKSVSSVLLRMKGEHRHQGVARVQILSAPTYQSINYLVGWKTSLFCLCLSYPEIIERGMGED